MRETTHTLKSVFTTNLDEPLARGEEFRTVLDGLKAAAGVPAAAAAGVGGAFEKAIEQVMAFELGEVLAESWNKAAALSQAIEATEANPEAVEIVSLADHKVISKHQPAIELHCDGKKVANLVFDIGLALTLQGVGLEIRRGAVAAVHSGKAVGQGTLGLAGKTLLDRSSPGLELPGRLKLSGAKAPA